VVILENSHVHLHGQAGLFLVTPLSLAYLPHTCWFFVYHRHKKNRLSSRGSVTLEKTCLRSCVVRQSDHFRWRFTVPAMLPDDCITVIVSLPQILLCTS
jgi:hypothetical protein